ncbi:hypothetical protein D3C80_2082730 [compost metagenome]
MVGQGNHADLHKAEVEIGLQDRVNRQDQRLNHVVQQMGYADGAEDRESGAFNRAALGRRHGGFATVGHFIVSLISFRVQSRLS